LPAFQDGDEFARPKERVRRSRTQPGIAAAHSLEVELARRVPGRGPQRKASRG
jgi:hypothetical protein